MARKKIMFGVGAGMISLALDGLSSMIVLGLLVRYLPAKEAGFWILITTTGAFLGMLQCGLGPTVAREVGQTRIPENRHRLPQLLGTVRQAFVVVAVLVVLVAVALHFFYLRGAARHSQLGSETTLAWFLFAAGIAMNLQGQGRLFILDGFGEVGWEKVFRIFLTTFGLAAIWLALRTDPNLVILGAISAVVSALFWLLAAGKVHLSLPITRVTAPPARGQLARLFHESGKILFLNLSSYAVTYFGVFVVQRQFGLASVTPFTAMLRVGILLTSVATLLPQMLYPYVATAWAAKDRARCRRYYLLGVAGAVGVYILMAIPLFLLGEPIFIHWLGKGQFLGTPTLALFLIYQLINVHNMAHASPVLATQGNAFIVPAIFCAVLTPMLVALLPRWFGFPGIPLGMILGILPSCCVVVWRSWQYMMKAKF